MTIIFEDHFFLNLHEIVKCDNYRGMEGGSILYIKLYRQIFYLFFFLLKVMLFNRFDGVKFLETYKGKKITFVGDSISDNTWQSLACLLHIAVPESNYTLTRLTNHLSMFLFEVDFFIQLQS
jgi:hypothetical protein